MSLEEIKKINLLANDLSVSKGEFIDKVNKILNQLDISDQLVIHETLTKEATGKIFKYLDEIYVHKHVKEHIVWHYYSQIIDEISVVNDNFIRELLNEYYKTESSIIISLLIKLIKKETLSANQVKLISQNIDSKEVLKKALEFQVRESVKKGGLIERDCVKKLMDLKAYETLVYAVYNNSVTLEAYSEFKEPGNGELDRKWKLRLFNLAVSKLKELR